MPSAINQPAPLATTDDAARIEHVDPMRRSFAGAANAPALQNTGVVVDDAYAVMGKNTGATGGACWFQSGNSTYTFLVDNTNGSSFYGGLNVRTGGFNVLAGNVGVTGNLSVTGTATFTGNVNVTGTSTFTGPLTVNGNLGATGTTTLTGTVNVSSTLTVISGALTVLASAATFTVPVWVSPSSTQGALYLRYNTTAAAFILGATNHTASSDLVFMDAGGVERFRVGHGSSTWQGITTGDHKVTGRVQIEGELKHTGSTFGVFNSSPNTKQTVTGAKGGNAALTSLLSALANYGLITDSTT